MTGQVIQVESTRSADRQAIERPKTGNRAGAVVNDGTMSGMNEIYTHPEYRAFVRAIRAAPDDDLPRKVCADWLEERGEVDRAEWIRVSIELARCDRAACDRCRKEWSRRRFSSYPVDLGWCDRCRTKGPFWPDVERSLELRRRKAELHGKWPRAWTEADEHAGLNTEGDRGFVVRVSGPLELLIGGECGRCLGNRQVEYSTEMPYSQLMGNPFMVQCSTCHGAGRTPGILRKLVKREPVRVVEVTDREPQQDDGECMWASAIDTSSWRFDIHRESLPMCVAKHLAGGRHHPESRSIVAQWWYPNPEAARAALSDAILQLVTEEVTR